ncbi:MAG: RNA polymerase sigma-70 factor (ECF subfamily) [Arenicella sp.]|jgi:RNA polymerase sigma-70 factor (ECF subfamily)
MSVHPNIMQGRNGSIQHQRFQIQVSNEVLNKAIRGDREAHAVLYQTYSNAVYTLAFGICGSKQCAEDVLHNTYIKLLNKLPSFEGRAPLGMWLRQIAVNESLMYLRKHKKHKAVISSNEFDYIEDYQESDYEEAFPASSTDFTDRHDSQQDINGLLSKLPEDMRMVLWLKEVEGYTHNEIAALVNKTPSYSKSVVSRALQFLRARIALNDDLSYSVGEH